MSVAYRDSCLPTRVDNSSDEGELSSSDSEGTGTVWQSKRPKVTVTSAPPTNNTNVTRQSRRIGSKNASLWGSVLTQQSSDDISSSLGAVGMTRYVSRGPESFDYSSAFNEKRQGRFTHSDELPDEEIENKTTQSNANNEKAAGMNKRKRKQNKDKSNNIPAYKPGQAVTLNRKCELSDNDPTDKVAEEIAFRLWERKRNLIRDITEYLGAAKTIEIYNKTEDIERNGGLLTYKGTRRRTPGGTFLHLIRNDPKLDQDGINNIFVQDGERERSRRKTSTKMVTENEGASRPTAEMKSDAMECNDVIRPSDKCDRELQQDAHGGTIESSIPQHNGDVLSDGEIVDSNENEELRVQPETFR